MRHLLRSALAICALALIAPGIARGEVFPDRTVRIVVPVPAGSSLDIATRLIADFMSAKLKQPFVVDNRPGSFGEIGTQQCAQSPADGYTICSLFYGTMVSAPLDRLARGEKPLYSESEFAPLARASNHGFAMIARKEVGGTLNDVREYARVKGKLNVGHAFPNARIAARALSSMIPEVNLVPSKAEAEIINNVLGGDLQAAFVNITTARGQVGNDAIRIVGTLGTKRTVFLPDVPTLHEQGGVAFGSIIGWGGYFAPAGIPKQRVQILSDAILAALKDQTVVDGMKKQWIEPFPAPADALKEQVAQDLIAYRKHSAAK